QDATRYADQKRLPEWEAGPPADDHEPRQHENDRGQRAGRRRDGLHDVVLEDRRVLDRAQDRHRDHRRGNRRRKREPDLEPQVNVRSGEHRRDQRAEDQAADRKFFGFHSAQFYPVDSSAIAGPDTSRQAGWPNRQRTTPYTMTWLDCDPPGQIGDRIP